MSKTRTVKPTMFVFIDLKLCIYVLKVYHHHCFYDTCNLVRFLHVIVVLLVVRMYIIIFSVDNYFLSFIWKKIYLLCTQYMLPLLFKIVEYMKKGEDERLISLELIDLLSFIIFLLLWWFRSRSIYWIYWGEFLVNVQRYGYYVKGTIIK